MATSDRRWQPPQTGDRLLDRSFSDLSDRLVDIDATLSSSVLPKSVPVFGNFKITDESSINYRGSGGHVIRLPLAASRGTGRMIVIYIENSGTGTVTLRPQTASETVNGAASLVVEVNSMVIAASNGVAVWLVVTPGGTAGHVIADEGTELPQKRVLNFVGAGVTAIDGLDETTVTIAGGTAGHVIQDEGTPLTQRPALNFVGAGVTATDAGGKTVVTIPGAAGIAGHIIDQNGTPFTQRASLDFTGDVIVTDDASGGGTTRVYFETLTAWAAYRSIDTYQFAGRGNATKGTTDGLVFNIGNWCNGTVGNGYLMAIPEIFPHPGTITAIAVYCVGGAPAPVDKYWVGLFSDKVQGNHKHYPNASLQNFTPVFPGGAGANFILTELTGLSIAVAANSVIWFVSQVQSGGAACGMESYSYRPIGEYTPANTNGDSQCSVLGWETTTLVTYNHSLATFPTTGTQLSKSKQVAYNSVNSQNRPSFFYKFAQA